MSGIQILLLEGHGILAAPRGFTLEEAARLMPGKKAWRGDVLHFQHTQENHDIIRKLFPDATWDDRAGILNEMQTLAPARRSVIVSNLTYKFRTKPFPDQMKAFNRSRDDEVFALLMAMGTGKTKVIIDTAAWLYINGRIDSVFIIAPNNVHAQWINEQLTRHLPEYVESLTHIWKRDKLTDVLFKPSRKLRWLSMNFEATITEKGAQTALQFLRSGRTLMVVDESHKIKNYKAKRTKQIVRLGKLALYRRILTGTPLAKGVEDYYSQFLYLDPAIIGHSSYFTFRNRYCRMGGYMNKMIIGYQNMDDLHSRIAPHTYQLLGDDVVGLPPLFDKRHVDLTAEQQQHFAAVKRELFTILDNGDIIETPLAVQKITRLQQITCGFLPREDGTFQILDNNRPLALDDILEEIGWDFSADAERKGTVAGEQAVIWCRYIQDINSIVARYGEENVIRYDGTINRKEQEAAKADWIAGRKGLFVGTPAKGGTGTDGLQGRSRIVVYYSNSFNSIDRWQSEKRTNRIGTLQNQLYIDIVARGSVDPGVLQNLRNKKNISNLSMNEIRAMMEKTE